MPMWAIDGPPPRRHAVCVDLLVAALGTLATLVALAIQIEDRSKKRRAERAIRSSDGSAALSPQLPPTWYAPPTSAEGDPAPPPYRPTSAVPSAAPFPTTWQPPVPAGGPIPATPAGGFRLGPRGSQAEPAASDASTMRRWVGPWLWAIIQALVIVSAVMIAVDLQGYVDWIDSQHTQIGPDRLDNVPTNAVFYTIAAAVISAIIALSRVRPPNALTMPLGMAENRPRLLRISLRGKIYTAYVPIDLAAAGAVITVHHRLVGPNMSLQFLGDWHWWAFFGLVAAGTLVVFVVFLLVVNVWFHPTRR
jgi:hypothetical protein